jgi:hypothetical protein
MGSKYKTPSNIMQGTRVKLFDCRSYTTKDATVVCRYGLISHGKYTYGFCYPDLVDVVFDHRPDNISRGHFTSGVVVIKDQRV